MHQSSMQKNRERLLAWSMISENTAMIFSAISGGIPNVWTMPLPVRQNVPNWDSCRRLLQLPGIMADCRMEEAGQIMWIRRPCGGG